MEENTTGKVLETVYILIISQVGTKDKLSSSNDFNINEQMKRENVRDEQKHKPTFE